MNNEQYKHSVKGRSDHLMSVLEPKNLSCLIIMMNNNIRYISKIFSDSILNIYLHIFFEKIFEERRIYDISSSFPQVF